VRQLFHPWPCLAIADVYFDLLDWQEGPKFLNAVMKVACLLLECIPAAP
jgi:hypothetical protein